MNNILRLLVYRQTERLSNKDVAEATFTSTHADFKPHYQKFILPKVKQFELRRIEALRNFRYRILIAVPLSISAIMIAAYVMLAKIIPNSPDLIVFGFVAIIGGLIWWVQKCIYEYQSSVKDQIFPLIFSFFGDDFKYTQNSPIEVSSLEPSEIIPSYDTEHTGDYVSGTYKGVGMEMLEAKMTKTEGSGKNRRTYTVFKGLFITLEAHKRFKGKTIIKRDMGMLNWAAKGFQSRERVRLEDPQFEKQFEVFADDQVEARYLLTTSFMERLLKLVELFASKGLQCSFYNSRLLIMIPTTKDYFKASSIFKPATFVEEINEVLEEMSTLFGIIDTLKLDQKTGL